MQHKNYKNGFIIYIRTSTLRQGTEGVSLEVQEREALQLAKSRFLPVREIVVETETAAKVGRPKFNRVIREIHEGRADGLIVHKLDRGSRNSQDWADISKLLDQGLEVYSVRESVDLQSRGGRLVGDMLAAVAADYVRNLRDETKKGIVGRLKQGLWPFGAPLGYVNNGKGQPKTIHPITGPLVSLAFDLYATGEYTLKALRRELYARGLRTSKGKQIAKNAVSQMLSNPFYTSLLVLRSTGEAFLGVHEPLITQSLFDQVQDVLAGRFRRKPGRHFFLYRGEVACRSCSHRLIGERQKGHIYYRCHSKGCAGTSIREERLNEAVRGGLENFGLFIETYPELADVLRKEIADQQQNRATILQGLLLQRGKFEERLNAATDAVIDGIIDKEVFTAKKRELLEAQARVEEKIAEYESGATSTTALAEHYLELTKVFKHKAFLDSVNESKAISKRLNSNLYVLGKDIELQCFGPFQHVLDHAKSLSCAHRPADSRTITRFSKLLMGGSNIPMSPHPRSDHWAPAIEHSEQTPKRWPKAKLPNST